MERPDIEAVLRREPFVPLRIHLTDGRKLDVPFQHVVVFQGDGVLVFKGVKKPGSHVATGFEFVAYGRIDRIEQKRGRGGSRRRKAS
jgi:hypothetical protein